MLQFSTPAILIRRTEYGDYDLIVTFFSLTLGKVSLMAKAAKKSTRRFAGLLELFTELDIVGSVGRKSGLPVLQEATLRHPHPEIREAPTKTAYASYWSELVNDWMEERVESAELFLLLRHVLDALAASGPPAAALSVLFQMRLLRISGHSPNLTRCVVCRRDLDSIRPETLGIGIPQGGIACLGCLPSTAEGHRLSKGTIKQLLWVADGDLTRAARIKFSPGPFTKARSFWRASCPTTSAGSRAA